MQVALGQQYAEGCKHLTPNLGSTTTYFEKHEPNPKCLCLLLPTKRTAKIHGAKTGKPTGSVAWTRALLAQGGAKYTTQKEVVFPCNPEDEGTVPCRRRGAVGWRVTQGGWTMRHNGHKSRIREWRAPRLRAP